MEKKKIKARLSRVLPCVLLLATLLTFCACNGAENGPGSGKTTADFTYRQDISGAKNAMDTAYLTVVNKQTTVTDGSAPRDLVEVDTAKTLYGKTVELRADAAKALEAMLREMELCGITDIRVCSGYRTVAYQTSLYNTYLSQEKTAHPGWSDAECRAQVETYSAVPGTSEHHTGLAVDLIVNGGELDESFATSAGFRWLQENARKFGFILRYPKGAESKTGYAYEPWHYRFVGVAAACAMAESGETLEEYVSH